MSLNDIKNKKVILRADFNVPLNEGRIIDDNKIIKTLPTINLLLKNNNKVIIITHLGRPKGKFIKGLTIDPIKNRLEELLNKKVNKINLKNKDFGELSILDNIRFFGEEEENNNSFSKSISEMGDIYVNDAFAVSHREHASVYGIQKHLPSYRGLLVEEEIKNLNKVINPKRPFTLILGGKKEDKIDLISKMLNKVDVILIGSYFGKYFLDENNETTKIIKEKCKEEHIKLIIPKKEEIYDIGNETLEKYKEALKNAKTVLWNGPLGNYEKKEFSKGTMEIINYLSKSKADIIIGGGELGEIYSKNSKNNKNLYISTGGGATLKFLGEGNLIGIKDLK